MRAPFRTARRRQSRAARLVAPLAGNGRTYFDSTYLEGWLVGLRAARYMRLHFPDFWAAHVAQKTLTTERLLGVFHAFLELANRELIELDFFVGNDLGFGECLEEDFPSLIDEWQDHGGILWGLADMRHWITVPPVLAYGLDGEEVVSGWAKDNHQLALAFAWMCRQTSWALWGSLEEYYVLILALPTLPHATEMDALAARLTWSIPLAGIDQPWTLGDVLRFVAGKTGNEFADYSRDEATQDMAWWCHDLFDDPAFVVLERAKQDRARHLRRVYDALNERIEQEPDLIIEIGRMFEEAVCVVRPADPGLPRQMQRMRVQTW